MKKLVFLVCSTLLISCSDDNSAVSVSCSQNTSTNKDISPNSIQVDVWSSETGDPEANVVVQLDHNGSCLLTDANGFARFDDLSSNTHDIHVMGKPGYEWQSEYYIDTSNGGSFNYPIDQIERPPYTEPVKGSFVNLKGSIQNSNVKNGIYFSRASDNQKFYSSISEITNSSEYTASYNLDTAVNTSTNIEMWAFESAITSGNYALVDAVRVPKFTAITTVETGNAKTQNITFQPPQAKLQKTELLKIGTINFPIGLTFLDLYIDGTFESTDFQNESHYTALLSRINTLETPLTLTSSSVLEAYISPFTFIDTGLVLSAQGGVEAESIWTYTTNKYPPGSTDVTILPKITNLPMIDANQRGSTISWSSANRTLDYQRINIRSFDRNATRVIWRVKVNSDSNQIKLPSLPEGQKAMLQSGTKYRVFLHGNFSYDPGYVNSKYIYESEAVNHYSTWTR